MKIIIVDDNIGFQEALGFYLKKLGHEIIATYSDGESFLEHHMEYSPDIVLMDISMPGEDGYTVTKKALRNDPSLKVISITMFQDEISPQKLIESGFKGCVLKQDVTSELKDALETVSKGNSYISGKT